MRKALSVILLCSGLFVLQGCLCVPVKPPLGWVFTEIEAPLDFNYDPTQIHAKSGRSESMSILGLVALGDASAKSAADQGGITTIHHADYEFFNVLGVYQRYRTVVYGQ
jgi:hypothetical protein